MKTRRSVSKTKPPTRYLSELNQKGPVVWNEKYLVFAKQCNKEHIGLYTLFLEVSNGKIRIYTR